MASPRPPGAGSGRAPDTRLFWATLTPGYRQSWEHFFLQAALGGGVGYQLEIDRFAPATKSWFPVPDAMLAAGARF